MLNIIFWVLLVAVIAWLVVFGIRASWGIFQFLLVVLLIPAILVALFLYGLVQLAIPILIVIGVVSIIMMIRR